MPHPSAGGKIRGFKKFSRIKQEPNQRDQWLKEAEKILVTELPVIPISQGTQEYAHHPALQGYSLDQTGKVDFSYAYFERQNSSEGSLAEEFLPVRM